MMDDQRWKGWPSSPLVAFIASTSSHLAPAWSRVSPYVDPATADKVLEVVGDVIAQRQTTPTRCRAAHAEDSSPCDGPADVVTIVDQVGGSATGCEHHGAVMLAALDGGRVYPGPSSTGTSAIDVFKAAQVRRRSS